MITEELQLEREHVHKVYDQIAGHFSDTRQRPWSRVADFLRSIPDGSLVADVGCGNGKYHGTNPKITLIGLDTSPNLLEIAQQRGMDSVVANVSHIPIRDGVFDAAICIAVIHHLANSDRRQNAIKQIVRLLVVGGRALIYVWAFEQRDKSGEKSKYIRERREERRDEIRSEMTKQLTDPASTSLPIHCNRTPFEQQDVLVPWTLTKSRAVETGQETDPTKLRYYHVFKEGELDQLIAGVDTCRLVESFYHDGNWCAIIERVS